MASNVAQRFVDLLVHIFRSAISRAMSQLICRYSSENETFRTWIEHRRQIGTGRGCEGHPSLPDANISLQAVLCTMLMYCDDPYIMAVGPDMTHQVLKVWS